MLTPNGKGWKRSSTQQELAESSAKLRALLDDAMLTQVEAADLLGIDHRTMRRYVLGQAGYSYCMWFSMLVLHEQKAAEKPNPNALRTLKREDLDRELDKWRDELAQCASASRAHARAADHLRAIHEEFIRRDEQRLDVRASLSQKTQCESL